MLVANMCYIKCFDWMIFLVTDCFRLSCQSQRRESNPQPPHYECGALPIEATPAGFHILHLYHLAPKMLKGANENIAPIYGRVCQEYWMRHPAFSYLSDFLDFPDVPLPSDAPFLAFPEDLSSEPDFESEFDFLSAFAPFL